MATRTCINCIHRRYYEDDPEECWGHSECEIDDCAEVGEEQSAEELAALAATCEHYEVDTSMRIWPDARPA